MPLYPLSYFSLTYITRLSSFYAVPLVLRLYQPQIKSLCFQVNFSVPTKTKKRPTKEAFSARQIKKIARMALARVTLIFLTAIHTPTPCIARAIAHARAVLAVIAQFPLRTWVYRHWGLDVYPLEYIKK